MKINKEIAKELLIALCPMLPYGVKIDREWIAPISGSPQHAVDEFSTFDVEILRTWSDTEGGGLAECENGHLRWVHKYMCKPYLRTISSMTEEEKKELLSVIGEETKDIIELLKTGNCGIMEGKYHLNSLKEFDWLNKNFFDYRGLIEKDMAIAVTKENNPYEK